MSLYYLGSADLSGLYQKYNRNWCGQEYPPKPWPDWFKGIYSNTIDPTWAKLFYYVPQVDAFILFTVMKFYPYDISILKNCGLAITQNLNKTVIFKGQDGTFIDWDYLREPTPEFPPAFWGVWGGGMGAGNRMYIVYQAWADPNVYEVDWRNLHPLPDGWRVSSYETEPPNGFGAWGPFCVVNREDGYIAWGNGRILNLFRLEGGVWKRFAVITTPVPLDSVCYESRDCLWWISTAASGSKVGKLNYKLGRHEFLGQAQTQYTDIVKQLITFDARRKRLVILRMRPDDPVTGACRWKIDFYFPLARVSTVHGLTDPIPVTRPRAGEQTQFVFFVVGDVGERLPPYQVTSALQEPSKGKLLTSFSASNLYGQAHTIYQGINPGSERLKLRLEVTDRFEYDT